MNDLSSLIFVALALAWAVYLIPKALRAHDEAKRSRSIDKFSTTMRVLARRVPVSRREARLVVTPASQPAAPARQPASPEVAVRSAAPKVSSVSPAQRRRIVLGVLAFMNLAFVALATAHAFSWWFMAVPVVLLVAWLVACRVMVKAERRRPAARRTPRTVATPPAAPVHDSGVHEAVLDDEQPAATGEAGSWDPVPVTLPTYVNKNQAPRRSVRTISLDDSDVWSSGRSDVDSALAREAEQQEAEAKAKANDAVRRAFGS